MNRYYFKLSTLFTTVFIALAAASCEKVVLPIEAVGGLKFDGIRTIDISDAGLVTVSWDAASMLDSKGALLPVTYTVYVSEGDSTSLTKDEEANQPTKLKLQENEMPRNAGKKVAATTSTSYGLKNDIVAGKKWAVEVVASAGGSSSSNDIAYEFLYVPGASSANSDKLEAYLGNFQSGGVNAAASGPLKARALKGSTPKAGETVTFAITQTPTGATGQAISVSSGITDASGVLATSFTAGDKDGAYMVTATWKTSTVMFVYYANLTADLQSQLNNLANPVYGNGSGITPPVAIAVGIPAQTTSATSYTFGVQDVAEYKYLIVSSSVTCADAANGYSASWTLISTPITVSGLSQGEKRLCLMGKNGAYVQQTATSYTWIINSAAPSTFAIIAPSVTTNSITPIVQWQPSVGAATYNLKVTTDAGCSTIVQNYPSLTTTNQTLLSLANGTYYVCVRAISAAGNGSDASNTGYGFLVDSSAPDTPAAPTTTGSYIASSTVTFTWVGVTDVGPSGITGYKLRVGTSSGASDVYSGFVGMVNSTSMPGLTDGEVYYAQVQAVDAAGNTSSWSTSSTATRVDISLTSAPTTLTTAATSAAGPDVRYASTGSFYVAWTGASDTGSGLLNYTLVQYSQANCAGTSTTTTGITAANYNVTGGTDGTIYSFKVMAYDNVGNFATSACSGNLTVFTAATVALTSFSGATGNLSGEINLTWVYPANTSRYASIAIRRISGATAPADCASGTRASTLTSFGSTTMIDQTLGAGSYFSYRACVTDLAGNVTSTNTAVNIQAKVFSQKIFTTRSTYTGNFGGYFGADAACTTSAAAGGQTADHWKAMISWTYNDASSRVGILGPIYRTNGTSVATSGADFWDGALATTLNYDEYGVLHGGGYVWTSTTSAGVNGGHHCAEWTSTLWTNLYGGRTWETNANFMWYPNSMSCANSYALFCMSQVGPAFKAVTGTAASGDVALTLTFPATTSSYGKVTIRRITGSTAPSSNCTTTGTEIANITNFTTQTITDATGTSAGFFSYRACLYDTANNLVTSTPIANIQSKGLSHRAFVTSTTYNGNLGGLNGADDKCAAVAASGGLSADHWRAILSTSFNNISQRLTITGPVYRTDGGMVATGSTDFWDGTLVYSIGTYENGVPYSGTNQVWTSSTSVGFDNGISCGNFTYANGNGANYQGLANYADTNWTGSYNMGGTCADLRRLYCISQSGPRFKADSGTVTAGDIVYSLTFPADTSTYGSVKIRRIAGTTAPNADCTSDGTQVANITTFSSGSWTDATGGPSSLFSYRACLYNTSNTLIQTYPVSAVRAMGTIHTIFTSNALRNGNFGGLGGMDAFCSSAASTAGLSGDHYKALASGTEISAKDRLDVRGPIIRRDGYVVATNAADLWDGIISVTLNIDENAATTTGTTGVWTGTNQAGLSWGECGGFKTSAYTLYQNIGKTDSTGAAWVQYYVNSGDSCANSYHVYCISQIGPRFSAATGTGSIGDITMTLNFPTTTSHMSNVTIRRILGDTPPNADCTSDGTQVANITSLTSQTLTDATGVNSGIYSYRACTYGPGNVLIGTFPFAQVRAKGLSHSMFVTSGTFNGSLGGLSGADSLCSNAANVAGILGDGWKAVMSDATADAKDRLVIKGPIYRGDGSLIAKSAADLWDSIIGAGVSITETGAWYTGTQYVWTGTSATGVNNGQNCGNWLSSSAAAGVWTGRADSGSTTWTENNTNTACSGSFRLYCLNKVGSAAPLTNFTAATGTVTNGDVTMTMTYPATTTDWARLDIRRLEGKFAPSGDCASTGSTVTSITNFATTSYTDNAPIPGRIYSYRACAYGTDGFLIGSLSASAIKARGGSHKIFMTTASYTGNLGGLAGADAKCAAAATAGGQTGTFVALLSTTSVNARDRYSGLNDPVYNTNNDLVGVGQNDLFDGSILASTNFDEYGNAGPGVNTATIWSQTSSAGTYLTCYATSCLDWTSTIGGNCSWNGQNGNTSSLWIQGNNASCSSNARLHCVSQ